MKRNLRFYFALLFARATALAVKLVGRKGTSMPGSWAIILCPDFLARMPKPAHVVFITGTNGKTSTANMVEDVLADAGVDFICNRLGTNVATGLASTLLAESRFWGKPKHEYAVFEVDERSAPHTFRYVPPELLLVTNIFRDSQKRNAHADFILGLLDEWIPKQTKLVLNGDDPLSSRLAPENERVCFGIESLPGDKTEVENIVNDLAACPVCGGALTHDVVRYHHIGRVHCERCGYRSPERDFLACDVDTDGMTVTVREADGAHVYPLANKDTINIYNSVSAVALLRTFGLSPEQIAASLAHHGIAETRYHEEKAGEKTVIRYLAKGQNPVACSRVFENVRDAAGKKAVILFLDDYFDAKHTVENISWYYDTDFEFLNDESIVQVVAAGARHADVYLRALLAGIPEEKLRHIRDEAEAPAAVTDEADTVFVLYDIYTIPLAEATVRRLRARFGGEKGGADGAH